MPAASSLQKSPRTRPADGNAIFAAIASGGNRAAVENQTGQVETRQRHCSSGNRLIAPNKAIVGIEQLPPTDQFDRIGNHFAADQGSAHSFRSQQFRRR